MFELRDFKPRLYQENIAYTSVTKNTLVVLPTGLGKTAIAMMLAVNRLNNFRSLKILFLLTTYLFQKKHVVKDSVKNFLKN